MSDQNSYDQLGVSESASFEEIQNRRDRLLQEHSGDSQKTAAVEAAYDSVLMQRLKLRQEGKIKVPDGIRFAERTGSSLPKLSVPSLPMSGVTDWFDRPEVWTLGVSTGTALLLGAIVALNPRPETIQLVAALATGSTLYALYRKKRQLGRSVLLGFGGLVLGYLLGPALYAVLPLGVQSLVPGGKMALDVMVTWSICLVLWIVSLFLK